MVQPRLIPPHSHPRSRRFGTSRKAVRKMTPTNRVGACGRDAEEEEKQCQTNTRRHCVQCALVPPPRRCLPLPWGAPPPLPVPLMLLPLTNRDRSCLPSLPKLGAGSTAAGGVRGSCLGAYTSCEAWSGPSLTLCLDTKCLVRNNR